MVGRPCAQAQEIFDLNAMAFDAALAALEPGRRWGDVFAAVEEVAGAVDGTMFSLLHGRGLGNDGPLVIPTAASDAIDSICDEVIPDMTTFILKPFLNVPEAPAAFARTHDVTWGDTIVVREGGAQRLGTRPRELTVAGDG